MVEIILVRHGETEWNTAQVFRGRADVLLSQIGRRQVQLLGEYLSGEKIDIIYSSPLQRAVATAQAIAGPQGLAVNIVANLNDLDFGQWQGLPHDEVREQYPERYRDWQDTPEQVRMPGGESLAEVRARVVPFVEDAVIRCGEGRVCLVTHRVVGKVLICALLGLDDSHFWNIRLDTAAVTRFEAGGGRLVLTAHNDTAHLHPPGAAVPPDF